MSNLTFINPPTLYDPTENGYSHVAVISRFDTIVSISGQGGETVSGDLPNTFESQCEQALMNIKHALEAASVEVKHIAKLTVLIVDHSEERLASFALAQARVFGVDFAPACTLIPVHRLALDGMLVEVEATCFV